MRPTIWTIIGFLLALMSGAAAAQTYGGYCSGQYITAKSLAVFGPKCRDVKLISGGSASPANPKPIYPSSPTTPVTPVGKYTCLAGWTLSGSQCLKPVQCPAGSSISGTSCVSTIQTSYSASCPGGMGIPDNRPICRTYNMRTRSWTSPTAMPSCPRGGSLSGGSCVTNRTQSTAPSCSMGTRSGSMCVLQASRR